MTLPYRCDFTRVQPLVSIGALGSGFVRAVVVVAVEVAVGWADGVDPEPTFGPEPSPYSAPMPVTAKTPITAAAEARFLIEWLLHRVPRPRSCGVVRTARSTASIT
jgi:hypothetical protein